MADHVLAITRIHGLAGRRDDLRALMRDTEARVAAEPGCLMYAFTVELSDPDEYFNVQEWTDSASFAAHQSSVAFADYQRALFDLLARPSDMRVVRGGNLTSPVPSGVPDPRAVD